MIRRPKRNSSANKKTLEKKESLIRQNSATIYGLYFASSNTDFLLDEKKTRFSLRPSVVVKQDRQTLIFDYSTVKGDEASIFDGFFRGLSVGGTGSGASAGSTLALDGGIESTCNFINDVTGIPLTNFADTYTISSIDVSKKIIVAIKANPITSTTAVMFESNKFIDLPQWTKTQTNKDSTLVNKIINLIPSQSMTHLGVFSGSILEFDRTSKNNGRFTVENVYNQNGFEVIDVKETVVYEDASGDQVIVSVYGEESPIQEQQRSAPPVLVVAPPLMSPENANRLNHCCPCLDCLYAAIREQESEGEANDGCNAQATDCKDCCPYEPSSTREERFLCGVVRMGEKFDSNCDGIKDCLPGDPCDRRTTTAQGANDSCDCGPYQISWRGFVNNSCGEVGPCSNGDGGYDNSCCELCQPGYGEMLCKPCPSPEYPDFNVCCAEKKRRSEKLMDCNWRRFNRNPPRNCPCTGNYENEYPGERLRCCTCEDMARLHNGGPCRGSTDDYWRDIKARMDRLCPNCRTNGNTPPVKEAPSVRPGRR